ncbi:MAG: protein kinase [Betaproteobacteria bacterium]
MPLTIAELQTLDRLLKEALELPHAARATWIDSLAAPHDTLAPLLRAHLLQDVDADSVDGVGGVETGDFLYALPTFSAADSLSARAGDPAVDERVGPYKLVRMLGEGGMSSVWLAERVDGTIRREVALKLPHRHLLDRGLAARMHRERDILAGLNHDHIARLYDAGVDTEGRPWLALEFVAGEPINTFCADAKIGLEGRIQLMVQVVRAVAHAHASLVVHRDLKPNNILVTAGDAAPNVKLLDFGIAKLLAREDLPDDATDLTQTLGRALTPDYASPEQLLDKPVTTASDIYSLGVVLYEVVTGEKPYKLKRQSAQALAEAVIYAEVQRPSKRSATGMYAKEARRVEGDLDAIILKALKATPEARYATASALADDLERWIAKEPVMAQPDSLAYRTRRLLQRHALAASAGAAVSIALIAGAGIALWQAQQARLETAKTRAVKDFLISIITVGNVDQQDAEHRRKQPIGDVLMDAAKTMPSRFADLPEVRSELQGLIATALSDLNLNDSATELQETRHAELNARNAPLVERMRAKVGLAYQLSEGSDAKRAAALVKEVVAALDTSTDKQERLVLAEALRDSSTSKALRNDGSTDSVLEAARSVSIVESLAPGSKLHASALTAYGFALGHNRDLTEAEPVFNKAIAVAKALPPSKLAYEALVRRRYAEILVAKRYFKRGLEQYREALAIIEKTGENNSFRWARNAVAMATLVAYDGDSEKSFQLFDKVLEIYAKFGKELEPRFVTTAETYYAACLVEYGRFDDAARMARLAYAPYEAETSKLRGGSAHWAAASRYGLVMQSIGEPDKAEAALNDALKMVRARKVSRAHSEMTMGERLLAINYLNRGEYARAEALLKEIIEVDGTPQERFFAQRNFSRLWLARAYLEQGKLAEAETEIATMAKIIGGIHEDEITLSQPAVADFARLNGVLAMKRGDAAAAVPHFQRAVDLMTPRQHAQSPHLASARADLALALATAGERVKARALADQARAAFATHAAVAPQLRRSLVAVDALLNRA